MSYDPHAPYVTELKAASNWAGLLRYALGHGLHMPALDAALQVLEGSQFGAEYSALRNWLEEFRQDPFTPRDAPDVESLDLSEEERITTELLATFPNVALCEMAAQFPSGEQTEYYRLGLRMTERWRRLARHLRDAALQASTWAFAARAELELQQLEGGMESYEEALAAYRQLAAVRPTSTSRTWP